MKRQLIGALVIGIAIGFITNVAITRNNRVRDQSFAKLVPDLISLRVLYEARILTEIQSNNILNASNMLVIDIGSNVSSLQGLKKEVPLSEQNEKAIKVGQTFLSN